MSHLIQIYAVCTFKYFSSVVLKELKMADSVELYPYSLKVQVVISCEWFEFFLLFPHTKLIADFLLPLIQN